MLKLTQQEIELFTFLKQVAIQQNIVIRVAGGWVRDKLLGRESHDIDIAVENCSGLEFANFVQQQLQLCNHEVHQINVINQNPEKSKHLQTATTKIFNSQIDFVELRSEVYDENSRIPIIKQATAQEDALRRDFTINALFYNIIDDKIEDYVQGVNDLMTNKILKTPLQAYQTFYDDPLRMLRAIRFSCKLKYQLDGDIVTQLHNEQLIQRIQIFPLLLCAVFYNDIVANTKEFTYKDSDILNLINQVISQIINVTNGLQFICELNYVENQIIGFFILAHPIDLLFFNKSQVTIQLSKFDHTKNQKQKKLVENAYYMVPFLSCCQSQLLSLQVKQFAYLVNQIPIFQECDCIDTIITILDLKIDIQVIDLSFKLNTFQQLKQFINNKYNLKLQIFSAKININIPEICNNVLQFNDRQKFQQIKSFLVKFMLHFQEFPNVDLLQHKEAITEQFCVFKNQIK